MVYITLEGVTMPGDRVPAHYIEEVHLGKYGFVEVQDGWLNVFAQGEAPDVEWLIDPTPSELVGTGDVLVWKAGGDVTPTNWMYRAHRANIL